MESDWKTGVVMGGWGGIVSVTTDGRPIYFKRAARLVTPVVVGGVIYRSLWQSQLAFGELWYFGDSDLSTFNNRFQFAFLPTPATRWPGTFVIEPDHP